MRQDSCDNMRHFVRHLKGLKLTVASLSVLQIRRGNSDDLGIISYISLYIF